jgi:L-cysteine desulfidase
MKKFILLIALTLFGFGAMSMGFPHNTYTQERLKGNTAKKLHLVEKVVAKNKIADLSNKATESLSFVEIIVKCVVKLFFTEVSNSSKDLAMNCTKQHTSQLEAIKNENELSIV